MISKIEFTSENLTTYAGLNPLLNYTYDEGIVQLLKENLSFENSSTERIKEKHLITMLSMNFLHPDKLKRIEMIKSDPLLLKGFKIKVGTPENVSRFLKKFNYRTTQELRDINIKTFIKLLRKSEIKEITIDIDSTPENVEGNQEGAEKGYNPGHIGNKCYNSIVATCWELRAFISGYKRPGNTYTSNGAKELIKEVCTHLKDYVDNIVFRMDSGYFNESIIKTIEEFGYNYVIKVKKYPGIEDGLYKTPTRIHEKYRNKDITAYCMKPNKWEKVRKFICVRELKESKQVCLFESMKYRHDFYVTNTIWEPQETVWFYEKRGVCELYIKEMKNDMGLGSIVLNSFWANEAIFQLQMLAFNIILLYKFDNMRSEYKNHIRSFRYKYIFVAAKIVKRSRQVIMKISKYYPYRKIFTDKLIS